MPEELYWAFLLLSTMIENVFPPFPGDVGVVFGGYLAGSGRIELMPVIITVMTGNIFSAFFMYFMGTKVLHFFRRVFRKSEKIADFLDPENLKKAHDWFRKWGVLAVVFSRFSPGIRFFVAVVAGMVRMNLFVFGSAFFTATVLWNSILIYGGWFLGDNWEQVMHYIRVYNMIVAVIIGMIVVLWLIVRYKKGRLDENAE